MPHIIVKMYPGKSEEQKRELTRAMIKSVIEITNSKESSISIGIEEVTPEEWPDKIYKPDIIEKENTLYKKPGYNPFE